MKIAVFHNLPQGGAKRALYEFSKELKKRGHTIDAYLPETANELFLPLDKVVDKKFVYPVRTLFSDINITGFRWLYLRTILLSQAMNQKHIADRINNNDYALVFVHHSVITQSPFILKYLKIPSLYYIQEPHRWVNEHPLIEETYNSSLSNSFFRNIGGLFFRTLIKSIDESNTMHASRILVNSHYSHESVMRAYGLNSYVVYLGVDTDKFKPDKNIKKDKFILSVGRIIQSKGFRFIINAIGKLQDKPKIIIISDEDNANERIILDELAKKNHVDMEILVNITDTELIKYYNKAMLVVYAPYLEPFGLVPLEAMACGTPVIGVSEGGIRESILDGITGMVTERDLDKFSDAIKYLIREPDKRLLMGKNAIEFIREKWTWEIATDNLINHFNAILANGN